MKQLTLEQKIGQLIMVGFDGDTYNSHIESLINNYVSNVILFSRNYKNPKSLQTLNKKIYKEVKNRTGSIPFIAIDEEGGPVTRLTNPFIIPPSQMTTSSSNVPDASYFVGKMIGEDLNKMGINVNFAPCLDLNPKLENETGHVRSYGDDPNYVSYMAKRFIQGCKENDVLCTLKHFPGEGNTLEDTHLNLPILNLSKEEINNNMIPFINNFDAPLIMATHILFKEYDNVPISLSKNVLTSLLRNQLNYEGIIITDCLEMNAIKDYYGTENAAVMSLKAGSDIVLISQTESIQKEAIKKIKEAIEKNELSIDEIDKKVERILKFKASLKSPKFEEYIPSKTNLKIMTNIVDQSITIVKGQDIRINDHTKFVIGMGDYKTIVEERENIDIKEILKNNFKNDVIDINDYKEKNQDVVLFLNSSFNYIKEINDIIQNNNTHIIAFKGPMILKELQNVSSFICLYEYTPLSINSAIKYLKGQIEAKGTLPLKHVPLIDSHIHFSFPHTYEEIEDALNISCANKGNLVAQIDRYKASDTIDCLYAKYLSKERLYVYGSLDATQYLKNQNMGNNLVEHIKHLMNCGCDGIKMLEGKPDQRKTFKIPNFDNDEWDKVFEYLEKEKINIIWHVNDPEEFWDINKIPVWAKKAGWFYDNTFINNEKQYNEIANVLKKHPLLHITFAHFYFMSNQLNRLDEIFSKYPNVCVDITPGIELFENLPKKLKEAKEFFIKYQDRIIYGTDISRCYYDSDQKENIVDTFNRSRLCYRFLKESKVDIELNEKSLLGTSSIHINGLALDQKVINKIVYQNFYNRNLEPKKLNINEIIKEIDREEERINYLNKYYSQNYSIIYLEYVKESIKK